MIYTCIHDFFEKAAGVVRLSREEEKELARRMQAGDAAARERLAESYLPAVAAQIKRLPAELQTLSFLYACIRALWDAVDRFDFSKDGADFSRSLHWSLEREVTRHVADSAR